MTDEWREALQPGLRRAGEALLSFTFPVLASRAPLATRGDLVDDMGHLGWAGRDTTASEVQSHVGRSREEARPPPCWRGRGLASRRRAAPRPGGHMDARTGPATLPPWRMAGTTNRYTTQSVWPTEASHSGLRLRQCPEYPYAPCGPGLTSLASLATRLGRLGGYGPRAPRTTLPSSSTQRASGRRDCPGVRPVSRRNACVKWAWLANPS